MSDLSTPSYSVEFTSSLGQVDASEWDEITGEDYPFLRHQFLLGLETTGCTTADSGWQPCHLIIRSDNRAVAVMPLYLKSHSYGEYVFDWSWADAWQRSNLQYYPKLITAIPFTPATGPRLCIGSDQDQKALTLVALEAIKKFAGQQDISSWHLLFPTPAVSNMVCTLGLHQRIATQFHWFNEGFESFDDFLATFSSRKRKSLRRERSRVREQGLRLQVFEGEQISPELWLQFYRFYQLTYAKRSGHGGYLTRKFFTETAAAMGEQTVLVMAYRDLEPVAGALYFRSSDTLYGRYWGCEQEFDCLHFEACYYQGIEYCIANGLQRFDPGAQGEHKIQRGFRPVLTYSNHWIADPALSAAVGNFTRQEAPQIGAYLKQAEGMLPFKKAD
ncbi:MAG: putative N-acyltransferase [Halieaceae bacterium]|jgi:predicted N-acyltransferase